MLGFIVEGEAVKNDKMPATMHGACAIDGNTPGGMIVVVCVPEILNLRMHVLSSEKPAQSKGWRDGRG